MMLHMVYMRDLAFWLRSYGKFKYSVMLHGVAC